MGIETNIQHDVIFSRFLQVCDIPGEPVHVKPFTVVIFGGAGDLTRRKLLPSLFQLYMKKELPKDFSILVFDRLELGLNEYCDMMQRSIETLRHEIPDDKEWALFLRHIHYFSGLFEDDATYEKLDGELKGALGQGPGKDVQIVYYMAVPPDVAPLIIEKLKQHSLCKSLRNSRIVMEKPFGHDHDSAAELNKILIDAFDERQIYRIDHYLARDPVQNIIFFHFSNTIFEEIWSRNFVDNVQITVAEEIGVGHRGIFYEQAGVVRDIVQNHMMQILGLIAMDPPVGFDANSIRDEKLKVMRSIRPMDESYIDTFTVRGQYGPGVFQGKPVTGYREEANVSRTSDQATFFAAKLYIDNLRWANVPFFIRTGKRMPTQVTEICIELKRLPLRLFGRTCDTLAPNVLRLTIQPDEKISLGFGVKYPFSNNQIYYVNMVFSYADTFKVKLRKPYERLLVDILKGDLTLFVREDEIEAMWTIVDPVINRWESQRLPDFPNYQAGTWGPTAAGKLLEREGRYWNTV
ncbi:MAG: glucose-6-phosphate dehydrogenase [Syntrophorhabdaceae bacterium]